MENVKETMAATPIDLPDYHPDLPFHPCTGSERHPGILRNTQGVPRCAAPDSHS